MDPFGEFIRTRREGLRSTDREMSVRKVAARIGVEPSFLSKVERGDTRPPSEDTIRALAEVLGEDPDVLLALGGKVSADLRAVIIKRPALFAQLIRELADAPDGAVVRIVREVHDGKW